MGVMVSFVATIVLSFLLGHWVIPESDKKFWDQVVVFFIGLITLAFFGMVITFLIVLWHYIKCVI